ncbi:MAG: hypothetical protein JWN98_372 [Abditibacteriota bacterium]|nr:hypothetical protein [Abditibacteriota bacterium]
MLVPNGLFDVVLFGALLVAAVLDGMFPALHGAASLLAVGAATYIAAQELGALLDRRGWWTQESLVTSLSLCAAGFIYYWWRNQSDFALLTLSVGLMMASLMTTIAVISSIGVAMRDGSGNPVLSLALLVVGGLGLGVLAGLLTLALGRTGSDASPIGKIIVVGLAFIVWKLRENLRPPVVNTSANAALSNAALGHELTQNAPSMARNLYGQPIEVRTVETSVSPIPASDAITSGADASNSGTSTETGSSPSLTGAPTAAHATVAHPAPLRTPAALPMGTTHPAIVPQRGTLLDRFLPALVLGALLFVLTQQGAQWLVEPFSPSVAADNRDASRSQPPAPPTVR